MPSSHAFGCKTHNRKHAWLTFGFQCPNTDLPQAVAPFEFAPLVKPQERGSGRNAVTPREALNAWLYMCHEDVLELNNLRAVKTIFGLW